MCAYIKAVVCILVTASYLFRDAAICQIACHIEYWIFFYFTAVLYFLTEQPPFSRKYCDCPAEDIVTDVCVCLESSL